MPRSRRTPKALEIYNVFSSTALFAMFSFQHGTAACLCWPSLPSSSPPHLQAIQAQEIQYYLKYLTKGLNDSLGRRQELPHGYSSCAGWQALRDSGSAASNQQSARGCRELATIPLLFGQYSCSPAPGRPSPPSTASGPPPKAPAW